MLLGNYIHANRNVARDWGIAVSNPLAMVKATLTPSFFVGDHVVPGVTNRYGLFPGSIGSYAWSPPMKAGGLAARTYSSGDAAGTGQLGVNRSADLSGEGGITDAVSSLIVSLVAAITGSGGISAADLKAFLQAVASLTGSGSVTASTSGLGDIIAALTASGGASGTATGRGAMAADLVVTGTGLTTANVGQAVWAAVAAANNSAGTMGEKLNDAGSGSNPWTEVIEAGYSASDVLRLIAAVLLGNASGLEGGAQAFTGLDGSTERVSGTYADGERTITGLDPTP